MATVTPTTTPLSLPVGHAPPPVPSTAPLPPPSAHAPPVAAPLLPHEVADRVPWVAVAGVVESLLVGVVVVVAPPPEGGSSSAPAPPPGHASAPSPRGTPGVVLGVVVAGGAGRGEVLGAAHLGAELLVNLELLLPELLHLLETERRVGLS